MKKYFSSDTLPKIGSKTRFCRTHARLKKTNSDIITEFAFFFSHVFFFKFYENNKRFIGGYERKRSGRLLTILNTYPDSTKYNKIADRETRCFAAKFIKIPRARGETCVRDFLFYNGGRGKLCDGFMLAV